MLSPAKLALDAIARAGANIKTKRRWPIRLLERKLNVVMTVLVMIVINLHYMSLATYP